MTTCETNGNYTDEAVFTNTMVPELVKHHGSFADAAEATGVSVSSLRRFQIKKKTPTPRLRKKIMDAFCNLKNSHTGTNPNTPTKRVSTGARARTFLARGKEAQAILEVLEENGMTRKEIADHVGATESAVSNWVRGKAGPISASMARLRHLVEASNAAAAASKEESEQEQMEQPELPFDEKKPAGATDIKVDLTIIEGIILNEIIRADERDLPGIHRFIKGVMRGIVNHGA